MNKAKLKKAMDAGDPVAFVERPSRDYATQANKCEIVALDAPRMDPGSTSFYPRLVNDGVRLRFAEAMPDNFYWLRPPLRIEGRSVIRNKDTTDIVVTSRQILDTWKDYEPRRDAILARQRAEQQSWQNAVQHRQDAAARLVAAGVDAVAYPDGIRMSVAAAQELADRLEGLR